MRLIGTVDRLPSGSYRFRFEIRGRSFSQTYPTEQEALEAQRATTLERATQPRNTLADFAETFLLWHEKRQKASSNDRVRDAWKAHIEGTELANLPMRDITERAVDDWVMSLRGARNSQRVALSALRGCLDLAKRKGMVADNPARRVQLDAADDAKDWTYLPAPEIATITTAEIIPSHERRAIRFAIGTGLRVGEQWALELADVHVDSDDPHIIVRYGGPDHAPTKTKKTRRVELIGMALEATREQLQYLQAYEPENPLQLLWPSVRGNMRDGQPDCWHDRITRGKQMPGWLTRLDIRGATGGPVTWHSLRHTCATCLVSGVWGRRWSLHEVADVLGHASVATTMIYAHLAEGSTTLAAREHRALASRHAIADSTEKQGLQAKTNRSGWSDRSAKTKSENADCRVHDRAWDGAVAYQRARMMGEPVDRLLQLADLATAKVIESCMVARTSRSSA